MLADNFQLMEASTSLVCALLSMVGFVVVATALTTWFLWRKARTPLLTLRDMAFSSREPWNTFPDQSVVNASSHYPSCGSNF